MIFNLSYVSVHKWVLQLGDLGLSPFLSNDKQYPKSTHWSNLNPSNNNSPHIGGLGSIDLDCFDNQTYPFVHVLWCSTTCGWFFLFWYSYFCYCYHDRCTKYCFHIFLHWLWHPQLIALKERCWYVISNWSIS